MDAWFLGLLHLLQTCPSSPQFQHTTTLTRLPLFLVMCHFPAVHSAWQDSTALDRSRLTFFIVSSLKLLSTSNAKVYASRRKNRNSSLDSGQSSVLSPWEHQQLSPPAAHWPCSSKCKLPRFLSWRSQHFLPWCDAIPYPRSTWGTFQSSNGITWYVEHDPQLQVEVSDLSLYTCRQNILCRIHSLMYLALELKTIESTLSRSSGDEDL